MKTVGRKSASERGIIQLNENWRITSDGIMNIILEEFVDGHTIIKGRYTGQETGGKWMERGYFGSLKQLMENVINRPIFITNSEFSELIEKYNELLEIIQNKVPKIIIKNGKLDYSEEK